MKTTNVIEIYEDNKTKKQFYVFPRGTDVEWARGVVARYRKRSKSLLVAEEHHRIVANGVDEIFPYDTKPRFAEKVLVVYQGDGK